MIARQGGTLLKASKSVFVGAVIPVRCHSARVFSLIHALEHQLVDTIETDLRSTGAVVSGYTTHLGLHLQIEALEDDESLVIDAITRRIDELPCMGAISANAKLEVLEELGRTSAHVLECRRLERWLHGGFELREATSAELHDLSLGPAADEANLIQGLGLSRTILVVASAAGSRLRRLFGGTSTAEPSPSRVEPARWTSAERHSVFAIPLADESHMAFLASLQAVCSELARNSVPFAFIVKSDHLLLALPRLTVDQDVAFLRACFRSSLDASYLRFRTTWIETLSTPMATGRLLLEQALHGGCRLPLNRMLRACANDACLARIALDAAFRNIKQLTINGQSRDSYEPKPESNKEHSIAQTAPHALCQAENINPELPRNYSLAAFAVATDRPEDSVAKFTDLPHRFKSVVFEVHTFLDHLLIDVVGPTHDIELLPPMLVRAAGANPWAWVAVDPEGGIQQSTSRIGAKDSSVFLNLSDRATSRRQPTHSEESEGSATCSAVFKAPGLLACAHEQHMALAHAMLHRNGLLSAQPGIDDIRGWVDMGLTQSMWGFSATITAKPAQAESTLMRTLTTAIDSHRNAPDRGHRVLQLRQLDFRGGPRGHVRQQAQTLLASTLGSTTSAGRGDSGFPPVPVLVECTYLSGEE
jgi:hypothetical protein